MKEKARNQIVTFLITFGCVLLVTCSCSVSEFSGKNPSNITLAPGETGNAASDSLQSLQESGPASTPAVTPALTAAPATTLIPTPTPIPTPVYIPRDVLPDGRLLEEGYFAVLPGEGAYYNVFDCYGKQIYTFLFTDGESTKPIGLFTEESLSNFIRLNKDDVQPVTPEKADEYNCVLKSNKNGFYQIDYVNTKVYLYNTEGKYIRTLSFSAPSDSGEWVDIVVACNEGETIVSFQSTEWDEDSGITSYSNTIYFVSENGTVSNTCHIKDLPFKPAGLLGRKYFIAYTGEYDPAHCNIYDFSGSLVKEDVTLLRDSYFTIWSSEANTYICICDYYMKNGQTYDSSFKPVAKNTVEPDGDLIYGAEYDVGGIICTALYWKQGGTYYESYLQNTANELVAVGTQDSKIAVKTKDSEYTFDSYGLKYYGINHHVLVLGPDPGGKFQVISLETGESVFTIERYNNIQIADEYILAGKGEYYPPYGKFPDSFILDKDGNVRFASNHAYAQCTSGEYIILYRGPYIGIADLNGDWIMKSLDWEMTRDEDYSYPWD